MLVRVYLALVCMVVIARYFWYMYVRQLGKNEKLYKF